jgi:hypothetical protein
MGGESMKQLRLLMCIVAALVGATALSNSAALADSNPAPIVGPAEKAALVGAPLVNERIVVHLTTQSTTVGKDTSNTSESDVVLSPGETGSLWFGAGDFDAAGQPDRFLQSRFSGRPMGIPEDELPSRGVYVWRADVRVVRAGSEAVTLDVSWTRFHSDRPGHPVHESGDTRTFTLRPHERHVFDFIDLPWSTCYRNISMAISVDVKEDEAFASRRIDYDVWLLEGAGAEPKRLGRLQLQGGQGEKVEARFPDVRYPLAGATFGDGREADAVMQIRVWVQGRMRADGTIDVYLSAGRFLSVAARGDTPHGGVGDGGHKTFMMRPGESVALPLPTPMGSYSLPRQPAARDGSQAPRGSPFVPIKTDVPGLTLTDDTIDVVNKIFFADKPPSLLLRTTVGR